MKTGEVEVELKSYTGRVMSVAFSTNGSPVVCGSSDNTVQIWNMTTGDVEVELKGHTDLVQSIASIQDGN